MTHRSLALAALLVGAGLAGTALTGAPAAAAGGLRCDIRTTASGGMIALDSVALTDAAANGSYSFRVVGGGTDIEQGGDFSAAPGKATPLGQVMVGKGKYKVDLTLTSKGKSIACSKRIG